MVMLDVCLEALYFHPSEPGVPYAIHQGKVLNPDFKTHWGARGTLGTELCHDQWKLWLSFLHYHARNQTALSKGGYEPTWSHPALNKGLEVESVFNMWRLHLGLADLGISCCWQPSDCFEATFFSFFRYAEVRHKLKIDYIPGSSLCMKNKFWGVGPGFGGEGMFWLNSWLALFGKGALNLSFGKFYLHQEQELGSQGLNIFDTFTQIEPIFNAVLGGQMCVRSFFVRLGWEVYLFFNQNQLAHFTDQAMPGVFVANGGCLALQGLSIGAGIEF